MKQPKLTWDNDWRKAKLMDWLLTPPRDRQPSTKSAMAELLQIDARTMRGWMAEPDFRDEWQRRVTTVIGDPDRGQQIMDTLYRAATDITHHHHVQAAKLYLEATNAIRPSVELTIKRPMDLTDAELEELLAAGARELHREPADE
jgi:hypothetical protein